MNDKREFEHPELISIVQEESIKKGPFPYVVTVSLIISVVFILASIFISEVA